MEKGYISIFRTGNGEPALDVQTNDETVWLSLDQMAQLYGRDKSSISKHLNNIYNTQELTRRSTVAKFATVATNKKTYQIEHYNLDAIISVGYRVNSKVGTRFRQWATQRIREHLIDGYTVNQQRLTEKGVDIESVVRLLGTTMKRHGLVSDEGRAMVDVVSEYARSWRVLLDYDEDRLPETLRGSVAAPPSLTAPQARVVITKLLRDLRKRNEATKLFALERGDGLSAILGNIDQTFDGMPLYPSAQQRAAHLLYFVIKDHPFADGNKRIGCLLFLHYLDKAGLLVRANGRRRFDDVSLVALALLVAESDPKQRT